MEDNDKYYKSRRFQRLLRRYEDALREGHTPYLEADELTDIAEYYMTDKQSDKATEAIETALTMHPDSVDPQIFLSRQKMFFGDMEAARRILDAITDQQDPEVIYLRSELMIKEGHADDASDYLLSMLQNEDEMPDSYLYDCTLIFMDYDQWQMAAEWAERLQKRNPKHAKLPIIKAEIEMGLDRYEAAIPMLEAIIEDDPYNLQAWNFLAESKAAIGRPEESVEASDFALAIEPDNVRALLQKAHALIALSRHQEVVGLLEELVGRQPEEVEAFILLGHSHVCLEHYDEALRILDEGERLALRQKDMPNDLAQIYLQQAFAYSQKQQPLEAIAILDKVRGIPYKEAWEYDMLEGEIFLDNRMPEEAEVSFAKAVTNSPDRLNALFSVGVTYGVVGEYETAISILLDVWNVCGQEEGAFVAPYLALYYYRKNDMEHFLQTIRMAVEREREMTESLFRDIFPDIAPEDYYAHVYRQTSKRNGHQS